MTSGARASIVSFDGCTDSLLHVGEHVVSAGDVEHAWRKPTPPLT